MSRRSLPSVFHELSLQLGLAAAYYTTGRIGMLLALPPTDTTPIWPPAGIALAGLLLLGNHLWPAVWLGYYTLDVPLEPVFGGASALLQLGLVPGLKATGATLQALLGSYLVRRFVGQLGDERGVLRFLLLAGPLSCLVSATIGNGTRLAFGHLQRDLLATAWWTWWVGDTVGVMLMTPLLILWTISAQPKLPRRPLAVSVTIGLSLFVLVFLFLSFAARFQTVLPRELELVSEMFFTCFLGVTMLGVIGRAAYVERLVAERTQELREANFALQRHIAQRDHSEIRKLQAEAERRETLKRLQMILDTMPLACILNDTDYRILYWNAAAERIFGYRFEELRGQLPFGTITPSSSEELVRGIFDRLREGAEPVAAIGDNLTKDRRTISCEWHNMPLRNADGTFAGILSMCQDVTERQRAEEALRESQRFVQSIAEASPHIMYVFDIVTRRNVYINRQIAQDLGYSPEAIRDMKEEFLPRLLHPDDLARLPATLERWRTAKEGAILELEYRMRHANGSWRWFLGRDVAFRRDASGRIDQIIGTAEDITDRKTAEQRLRASLQEKESLLKEVHHRVKNNLQVINSLLNLQAERIADPAVRSVFVESQSRVRSMALIHESLYRSGNLARVDMAQHVASLCQQLYRTYAVDPNRVRLRTSVVQLSLELERAVPLGLIINELVANALKYAFSEDRGGEIDVELHADLSGTYTLIVADNGKGLPADFVWTQSPSLGLQLVATLTRQLRAQVELDRARGTTFRIAFPGG